MKSERRSEILNSARKCFLKYGYEKTTLDDIGNAVGINKVSLYYYYKNKEAIFAELIKMEAFEFSEHLKRRTENIKGYKQKILQWIEDGFNYSETDSLLNRISYETLKKMSPHIEKLKNDAMNKGTAFISGVLKSHQQINEVIACDSIKVAKSIQNIIYAMKDSYYLRVKSDPNSNIDIKSLLKDVLFAVSLILDGISR